MNFFEHQDRARRNSRYLILFFIVAVVGIVAAVDFIVAVVAASAGDEHFVLRFPNRDWLANNLGLMIMASLATVAFVALASLHRSLGLRSGGGGKVARDMGGVLVNPDSSDPEYRRLINVIEEISIASGVPVPEVYVLESEPAINAFAAGYSASDAIVAVSRGCLDHLTRNELQGVIAHEFSHVLNGDMRLNIRLMGVLFGVLAISLIGRMIVRGLRYGGGRKGGGAAALVLAGAALFFVGYIGLFCGRVIKAAVSRQREYLADASAVQFTRQTGGIAGALKKIGGIADGSELRQAKAEEISHMLFARGLRLSSLLATHPPLVKRIEALEPGFDPAEFALVTAAAKTTGASAPAAAGLIDNTGSRLYKTDADVIVLDADSLTATVGQPTDAHLSQAAGVRASMPAEIVEAAHSRSGAISMTLALLLDRDENIRRHQQGIIEQRMGRRIAAATEQLFKQLRTLGPEYRLPILDLVFPVIRSRSLSELDHLDELAVRIIEADGRIDTFEYALSRSLRTYLADMRSRSGSTGRKPARIPLSQAVPVLFALLARHGHDDERDAAAAYSKGLAQLMKNKKAAPPPYAPPDDWPRQLDLALARLDALNFKAKQRIMEALVKTLTHDGRIALSEAELLRAVCVSLHIPLPPMLPGWQ